MVHGSGVSSFGGGGENMIDPSAFPKESTAASGGAKGLSGGRGGGNAPKPFEDCLPNDAASG